MTLREFSNDFGTMMGGIIAFVVLLVIDVLLYCEIDGPMRDVLNISGAFVSGGALCGIFAMRSRARRSARDRNGVYRKENP